MTEMHTSIPEIAKALHKRRLEPLPIAPGKKYPTVKNWRHVPLPIEPWPESCGIGLRTGEVTGIDLDIYDASLAALMVDEIRGHFPGALTRIAHSDQNQEILNEDSGVRG
jgi:hypothetical protein